MNNINSLLLPEKVNAFIFEQSAKLKVDLNTVEHLTPALIQVGYSKTGLMILIRKLSNKIIVESFKCGDCIKSLTVYNSMNNDSVTNEALIKQIQINVRNNGSRSNLNTLYWSIVNLTILPRLSSYDKRVEQVTPESIAHHGCKYPFLKIDFPQKQRDKNIAIAMRILRKKLPYNSACFCLRVLEQNPDTLYHAINDFKYHVNCDFWNIFDLSEGE